MWSNSVSDFSSIHEGYNARTIQPLTLACFFHYKISIYFLLLRSWKSFYILFASFFAFFYIFRTENFVYESQIEWDENDVRSYNFDLRRRNLFTLLMRWDFVVKLLLDFIDNLRARRKLFAQNFHTKSYREKHHRTVYAKNVLTREKLFVKRQACSVREKESQAHYSATFTKLTTHERKYIKLKLAGEQKKINVKTIFEAASQMWSRVGKKKKDFSLNWKTSSWRRNKMK